MSESALPICGSASARSPLSRHASRDDVHPQGLHQQDVREPAHDDGRARVDEALSVSSNCTVDANDGAVAASSAARWMTRGSSSNSSVRGATPSWNDAATSVVRSPSPPSRMEPLPRALAQAPCPGHERGCLPRRAACALRHAGSTARSPADSSRAPGTPSTSSRAPPRAMRTMCAPGAVRELEPPWREQLEAAVHPGGQAHRVQHVREDVRPLPLRRIWTIGQFIWTGCHGTSIAPGAFNGHGKYLKLLSPYRLGRLELKNRLVMAPMTRSRALVDGNVPNPLAVHLLRAARLRGPHRHRGHPGQPQGVGYIRTPGIHSPSRWRAGRR